MTSVVFKERSITEPCPAKLATPWLHSLTDDYVNDYPEDLGDLGGHWVYLVWTSGEAASNKSLTNISSPVKFVFNLQVSGWYNFYKCLSLSLWGEGKGTNLWCQPSARSIDVLRGPRVQSRPGPDHHWALSAVTPCSKCQKTQRRDQRFEINVIMEFCPIMSIYYDIVYVICVAMMTKSVTMACQNKSGMATKIGTS